jgi:diaminobutyrate-2-oxoglutarate transaminase
MLLIKREFDEWKPGEHNGTFRGNNPAFVTATAALQEFWQDDTLTRDVRRKALTMRDGLLDLAETLDADVSGRGLIQGIRFNDPALAGRVAKLAFQDGLIIETCGPRDEVLKCLPPLTISDENLRSGLQILGNAIGDAANIKVSVSVP